MIQHVTLLVSDQKYVLRVVAIAKEFHCCATAIATAMRIFVLSLCMLNDDDWSIKWLNTAYNLARSSRYA